MPARLTRVIAVAVALAIVVGTGVAWGKIRSFESGINHFSSLALGEGGDDGAIDVLLVGLDSRTDAHGNPLSEEELATLRAGDDVSTNTWCASPTTGSRRRRSPSPATPTSRRPVLAR